eukprot:Opistho-2@32110
MGCRPSRCSPFSSRVGPAEEEKRARKWLKDNPEFVEDYLVEDGSPQRVRARFFRLRHKLLTHDAGNGNPSSDLKAHEDGGIALSGLPVMDPEMDLLKHVWTGICEPADGHRLLGALLTSMSKAVNATGFTLYCADIASKELRLVVSRRGNDPLKTPLTGTTGFGTSPPSSCAAPTTGNGNGSIGGNAVASKLDGADSVSFGHGVCGKVAEGGQTLRLGRGEMVGMGSSRRCVLCVPVWTSSRLRLKESASLNGLNGSASQSRLNFDAVGKDERGDGHDGQQRAEEDKVELLGVCEVYDKKNAECFSVEDESMLRNALEHCSILMRNLRALAEMRIHARNTALLLTTIRSMFEGGGVFDLNRLLRKIMNHARKLVHADRCSIFLVDEATSELYSRVFDVNSHMVDGVEQGEEEPDEAVDVMADELASAALGRGRHDSALTVTNASGPKSSTVSAPPLRPSLFSAPAEDCVRFPLSKGIAGHVATTGEVLNIVNAYADSRFNKQVDQQTGYKTNTILCMPIRNGSDIIGVAQMVNKVGGCFTATDERLFAAFAAFCGLAIHHAQLYEKLNKSEQMHKVALEVLSYHAVCHEHEWKGLCAQRIPKVDEVPLFLSFDLSPFDLMEDQKPLLVLRMFEELGAYDGKFRVDKETLCRFVLTVRKNYRRVPYHNWTHAFNVAHTMYLIIQHGRMRQVFTEIEIMGLFVACLCHDLDHRGTNNQFQINESTALACLYSTAVLEHHHFAHTVTILRQDGHDIFARLSKEQYSAMLGVLRHAILATDLASYPGNRKKLETAVEEDGFNKHSSEQVSLLRSLLMTACDISAVAKPWVQQESTARTIFEEFYAQGDAERASGRTPIAMMDRSKSCELPQMQIGFIDFICAPAFSLLARVIPATKPLCDNCLDNRGRWKERVDANCMAK